MLGIYCDRIYLTLYIFNVTIIIVPTVRNLSLLSYCLSNVSVICDGCRRFYFPFSPTFIPALIASGDYHVPHRYIYDVLHDRHHLRRQTSYFFFSFFLFPMFFIILLGHLCKAFPLSGTWRQWRVMKGSEILSGGLKVSIADLQPYQSTKLLILAPLEM